MKKDAYTHLDGIGFEKYRSNNQKVANRSIKACKLTDFEKVQNGTHHWIVSQNGKTRTLKLKA